LQGQDISGALNILGISQEEPKDYPEDTLISNNQKNNPQLFANVLDFCNAVNFIVHKGQN